MSCTKYMLTVVMDGIRDVEMLEGYIGDAVDENKQDIANWFMDHAENRLEWLQKDYDYVMNAISVNERIKNGDDIALALKEHIDQQIDDLKAKLNKY